MIHSDTEDFIYDRENDDLDKLPSSFASRNASDVMKRSFRCDSVPQSIRGNHNPAPLLW